MGLESRVIWVDGELLPWGEARVHVLSQSIQRGSLVFDVMACTPLPSGPAVFGMCEHVDRFLRSAALNDMQLECDRDEILAGVSALVRANPGSEMVKLSAYHTGISLDVLPVGQTASVALAAFSFEDVYGRASGPLRPARLQVAESIKLPPRHLSPQVKIAASYTAAAVAKRRARDAGFDDILFLDERGCVAESSTQSFFLVERGIVRTAPTEYVLEGITRRAVLELCADEGIEVKEEPIERSALETCDEAFLTGTTINVWPVARIDAREFVAPGPLGARLAGRMALLLAGEDPEFSPRWMQPV